MEGNQTRHKHLPSVFAVFNVYYFAPQPCSLPNLSAWCWRCRSRSFSPSLKTLNSLAKVSYLLILLVAFNSLFFTFVV